MLNLAPDLPDHVTCAEEMHACLPYLIDYDGNCGIEYHREFKMKGASTINAFAAASARQS